MPKGFWNKLPRPFVGLAPMSGYTDAAFRRIVAKYGKPDVMCAEFVPADCLVSVGLDNIRHHLWYSEQERPIVAQIYGGNPDSYEGAAQALVEIGFDGIDINMGCPAKAVEKRLGGSMMMKNPDIAVRCIEQAKKGAGPVPVSVKTRIGYGRNQIDTWLPALMSAEPAAITIHARTRRDTYKVPAKWEVVTHAVELARESQPDPERRPLIIGNGDVGSLDDAHRRANESGCDGVFVGRGIYGDPWFFNKSSHRSDMELETVLKVMLEHTELYVQMYADLKPLEIMKKHFKAYVNDFHGASRLRAKLMGLSELRELKALVENTVASGIINQDEQTDN